MMTFACNPSTQEAEAGGWQVQGQPGLHSETSSKTQKPASPPSLTTTKRRLREVNQLLEFSQAPLGLDPSL
jgi:hypothetical protein